MVKSQVVECSVKQVFGKSKYSVPIYQRNYAWGKEEIERLIEDINDFENAEETREYFLGNLIVDKVSYHHYSVIDGQQRLTTLFLLLTFLKIGGVTSQSLRFESRSKSNDTLEQISEGKVDYDDYNSKEIISGYHIIAQYFEMKKATEDDYDAFEEAFKKKLDSIKLIRVEVPKDIDLNHYFEIMNTRGEQLKLHEIVKARILQQLSSPKEKAISGIIWDACSNMDSYIQMNFERNFRDKLFGTYDANDEMKGWNQFESTNFGDLCERLTDSENHIENNKMFTLKAILEMEDYERYDNQLTVREDERFSPIMDFPNFLLQVNASLQINQDSSSLDDKLLLKTLSCHWKDEQSAKDFLYHLLLTRFKFDQFIIKRDYQKDLDGDGKWSLKRLFAYKQRKNITSQYKNTFQDKELNEQLLTLQAILRTTFTSPKTMHWVTKVLKLSLDELTVKNLIAILEKDCILRLGDYRKYSGFGVPHLVFTYLDYILWRDKYDGITENWEVRYRTSIEHFSPQHPADGKEPWEYEDLNGFGNLALISIEANSKFSNLSPESKVHTYTSVLDQSPKLQLMSKYLENYDNEWTKQAAKALANTCYDILDKEMIRLT